MKAFLHGAPIGALGGLTGLGDGEIRLPVLTRIFWHNVKLAVPIILAVSLLTVVSATITRISITSVEGLVPIYSIVFILAVAGMVGAYVGTAYLYRLHETGLERVVTGLFLLTTSLVFQHIST